jgi:hypothetical protein
MGNIFEFDSDRLVRKRSREARWFTPRIMRERTNGFAHSKNNGAVRGIVRGRTLFCCGP